MSAIGNEFNNLLSGELSAVESYDLALRRQFDPGVNESLLGCRGCHEKRVQALQEYVIANGETPCKSSGPFGAIASLIENSASTPKAALQLLEELEAERLVQYEAQIKLVSPEVVPVLEKELLPAQHRTHLVVSTLAREVEEPANA